MKRMHRLWAGLLTSALLSGAPVAYGALPIDACTPPSAYPFGPGANAEGAVTFTAYDRNTTPFVIQFWREPCPGPSARSLLWARFPCGTHDFGFAMLQPGAPGIVEYDVAFNGNCSFQPTTTTFLIEQDARDTMFRNSGEVTLIHRGAVLSSGTLPAYGVEITPAVGLWWNPSESGTGYNIDVKHGILVLTVYSFKTNGDSEWYIATGALTNGGRNFSGVLDKARGGQCISCPYSGPPVGNGNDGPVTISFTSPTAATMTLPGGRVINIEPEAF